MRIGLLCTSALWFGGEDEAISVEDIVTEARQVRDDGLSGYWIPEQWDTEPISLISMLAPLVPDIEMVASVIPILSRHPLIAAQETVTVQLLTGGRFTLALGVGHKDTARKRWGCDFEHPVARLREYLSIVLPLVREGHVEFSGEIYSSTARLRRCRPWPETSVLVGAMGPNMLRVAGQVADGTVTWLCGLGGLRDHVVPTITAAAAEAGRSRPRVAAMLPLCVTADEAGARQRIAAAWAPYQMRATYQNALARSGATDAGAISLVGSPSAVSNALDEFAEAGVTDFVAVPMSASERELEDSRSVLREASKRLGEAGKHLSVVS
jgi:F420-dependent oxidoreductase-like protein